MDVPSLYIESTEPFRPSIHLIESLLSLLKSLCFFHPFFLAIEIRNPPTELFWDDHTNLQLELEYQGNIVQSDTFPPPPKPKKKDKTNQPNSNLVFPVMIIILLFPKSS